MNSTSGCLSSRSSTQANAVAKTLAHEKYKEHSDEHHLRKKKERDVLLGIQSSVCFYCGQAPKKDMDHYVPTCNTTQKVIGSNSPLNLFPSCKDCNIAKSGKLPNALMLKLIAAFPERWTDERIGVLKKWTEDNRGWLYNEWTDVVESNMAYVKELKRFLDSVVRRGKCIRDHVVFGESMEIIAAEIKKRTDEKEQREK